MNEQKTPRENEREGEVGAPGVSTRDPKTGAGLAAESESERLEREQREQEQQKQNK